MAALWAAELAATAQGCLSQMATGAQLLAWYPTLRRVCVVYDSHDALRKEWCWEWPRMQRQSEEHAEQRFKHELQQRSRDADSKDSKQQ